MCTSKQAAAAAAAAASCFAVAFCAAASAVYIRAICVTAVSGGMTALYRHWKEVMRITGKELNLAEDVFKLQHLLDCKLLKVRDDMEELTNSAVKEEQIETKLATVGLDWAEQNLVFSDYKTRGPVILKASQTWNFASEVVTHASDLTTGATTWSSRVQICDTWCTLLQTFSPLHTPSYCMQICILHEMQLRQARSHECTSCQVFPSAGCLNCSIAPLAHTDFQL